MSVDLRHRMHVNFRDFYRLLAKVSQTGAVAEVDGMTLTACGVGVDYFNPAILSKIPDDLEGAVRQARTFYRSRGLPWKLATDLDFADAVAPGIQDLGLEETPTEPGMIMPLGGASAPELPLGVSIRVVGNTTDLAAYNAVYSQSYDIQIEQIERFSHAGSLTVSGYRNFVAYVDRMPAGIASVLVTHGIAGVQNVGVAPAFRRRGLGGLLAAWAATNASEVCDIAYLQASEAAVRAYERTGFQHVLSVRGWTDTSRR